MGPPPGTTRARTAIACLFLLFLVPNVLAAKCNVGCHGMQGGKGYKEGRTYVYDLEGQAVTSATEGQNASPVTLKATVELSVKPDCVQQLRLKNVKLNGAGVPLPEVEKHAVQFNYHDGHIDSEICTEPGDTQASLNIKRAVVSMFQSAVLQESGSTTHHETDIFGGCPTTFDFHKEGDSLVVRKDRNLAQCSYRESINQGLITGNFDTTADIKSTPLLDSTQEIVQRYKQGVLNKATSKEVYNYMPFRNGNNGAKTVVETTLTLKNEKGDNPTVPVSEPKSVIFEAPHPTVKSSVDALTNALKAAKAEVSNGVKPEAASKFSDLVKVLRHSSQNDILSVYQKVRSGGGFDKVADLKLFLDALFRAGTGEATEVAATLVKNREISGIQALMFYASLPLISHVNLPSISTITSLLDQPNLPRMGYLGIGHVIGKYCQQHTCENVPEIKDAIHKLREKVGNGKAKIREQEDSIVTAIKALGNTRFMDDATLQKLANIAADKNVKNRVRVAAIEALPTRCTMKWKNILLKVLADREEDSEIRIKSYLSLTSCPCPHVANQLKEVLDKETVNQVGSFIQSHLRHLRATTDPSKQEAKRQLGLIKPRTKFPEDFRKFSFNNELSYHLDSLGVGSSLESNVIYSQNSFVPRSASLNLTTELFGRSFNFLELNTRIENLDRLIEHYFGPKGAFNVYDTEHLPKDVLNKAANIKKYIHEQFEKAVRGKREVKQGELDRFAKNVRLRSNEVDQDLDIDLSMKLFGVELGYLSYHSDGSEVNPEKLIDQLFNNMEKGFDGLKNFNYDIQNHAQFLDGELVYPTGIGAPLSLGVVGSSVVHLKTKGKIDLPVIIDKPQNAKFHIALEPSASIRIVGSMAVHTLGVKSGLKIVGTLYTSTGSDVTVSVLNGHGIDVNFGLPVKKQELISMSSEVLLSSGSKGEAQTPANFGKGKEYSDCFEQFSPLIGMTVCGQVVFPYENTESIQSKPLYPLNGPAKFSVNLESNDVSSYHFKVFYNTEKPKARSFEILLDTPNSKTNRRISLLAEGALEPNKFVKITLDSPIKKASAEVVLKNTDQERSLSFTVQHDQIEYYIRAGLLASGNKYKPLLEYKIPEHIEQLAGVNGGKSEQQYNVQGSVDVNDYEDGKKFIFDNVAITVGGKKLFGLDGNAVSTPNKVQVDMNVGYGEESLALKLDGKRHEERNYEVSLSAIPSRDPNIGFSAKWNWKRTADELDHKLVFVHGNDFKSEVNRLTIEQNAIFKPNPTEYAFSTKNKITYPALDFLIKFDGKIVPKQISGDFEVKYEKFKMGTELSAKINTAKQGDYEIEFEAEVLQNSLELKAKRTIMDSNKSKFKNSLVLSPGGKYDADAVVTYDVGKNNINMQADGELNLNGKKVQIGTGLEVNSQVVNSRAQITLEGAKYIDFVLKMQRGTNPNGNMNLNLKNYLTANGEFNYQNGKGNANLNIDIPKINRKIKAVGDLTVTGSQHAANMQILYDADKDPNKQIKFSTVSDITKNAFDTKNVLEILSYKLELNGKGKMQGSLVEGQLFADIDLTLPNGRYLVYKIKRNISKKGENCEADGQMELIDFIKKGGESRKLSYTGHATDVNMKLGTMNGNGELKFVNFDGKDALVAWKIKRLPQDQDKKLSYTRIDISGSSIPKPVKFEMDSTYGDHEATFSGKSSVGSDFTVQSSGNYKCEGIGKPQILEYNLDMKLPSEKLRNIKLQHSHTILIPLLETGTFEYTESSALSYNDKKPIKFDAHSKILKGDQKQEGEGEMTLTIMEQPPLTIGGGFSFDPTGAKWQSTHTLNAKYGNSEANMATVEEYAPDLSFININAKGSLPFEKLRNIDLHFKHASENDGTKRNTEITVNTPTGKYSAMSDIQVDEITKMLHASFACPNTDGEVLLKSEKHGEYKGDWKLRTPQGYMTADVLVNLESVDNFVINANFDSDKVKPSKIHAEIANKPTAKNGRRIVIVVTSDGQNIVTGSTNYKKRDEDGKVIVEGNGNLKIGENVRSSSFKYTRQELTRETDGEVGVTMVLNANFGPSAIVGELKLSNKEVHVFNSYCEQNKDCAHFKFQSTLDTDHKTHFKHQATLEVDLKKFNVPAEFGMKSTTEYKGTFDHTASLYLHSSKDKSEYSYQVYAHPKDSAIIITLPTRELAFIVTFDLPKTKQTGAYKFDASLYLDKKNKPNEKTSLTATGDMNIDKNSLSLNGETKFTYPTQPKDMIVKGRLHYGGEHLLDANVDIDVFAKKSQKITIVAKAQREPLENGYNITNVIELNSRGQQLKLDLKSHFAFSPKQFGFGSFFTYNDIHLKPKTVGGLFSADFNRVLLLIISPNKELLKSETHMDLNKDAQKINTEVAVFGNKPYVFNFEADGLSFKYVEYNKENPNNKLTVDGRVVFGQLAEIHANAYKDGAKKELFHALVHLDERKFLKPDFGYNKDNVNEVIDYRRAQQAKFLKQLKEVMEDMAEEQQRELKDLFDHLIKAQPNVKPLLEYYQTELNKLKNEVNADETIKEINATLKKYFGAIVVAITETAKQFAERLAELEKQYNEIIMKLRELITAVYPQLKESYTSIVKSCLEVFDAFVNLGMVYVKGILHLVNQHQKDLKEVAAVISEFTQDIAKIVFKTFSQIKQDTQEFVILIINQLKALPIFEILKEKYQEFSNFQLPEVIVSPIEDLCTFVRSALPTQELQDFFGVTCQYIMKVLKRQKVDDTTEIKKIYSHAITAIQSILSLMQAQVNTDSIFSFVRAKIPFDFSYLAKIPRIGTLSISALNLIRERDIPSPQDLYYTYRPTHRFSDIIPPFSMTGIVLDGGHIFTFDNRHFTMTGNCHYVLAQDMQDGNFSIIANFNNGNLASITLTEPKESITFKANDNILVNNKPGDYPANTKNLRAFLNKPFANLKSDYGVHIACINSPSMLCAIRVSGFYLGKVRGLLGDGNNEPYDDYTLPNGKITENEVDFVNGYKLKGDCPAATIPSAAPRDSICTGYFSGETSIMKSCFNYVNPHGYREACDQAMQSGNKESACLLANAYAFACYEKRVPISIPHACVTCKVEDKTIPFGDTFSVKIPKKEADVIFVVEQDISNEKVFKDMVTPLMSELRDEFKHHGITDVHIGLIGFGEKMEWPLHYSSNGNTNIEGDVKNMKFEEKDPIVSLKDAKEGDWKTRFAFLGQRMDVELGTFRLTDAYEEAIRYPYRAGAAKAVIGVIATPCEKSPFLLSLQNLRLILGQKIYRNLGLTYYHVTSNELQVSGKMQKNIVGYDADSVYTFADSKKKPLSGNTDMKSNLATPFRDVCADFAISSGGAAFSSDNFLEGKPNQRKQFIQVAARRIVEDIMNTEFEEDCRCEHQYGMIGRPRCKIVGRKEKEPLAKHTKGGVKS